MARMQSHASHSIFCSLALLAWIKTNHGLPVQSLILNYYQNSRYLSFQSDKIFTIHDASLSVCAHGTKKRAAVPRNHFNLFNNETLSHKKSLTIQGWLFAM